MSTGRFWAIGVGPGDPQLLTVKAVSIVRQAHVVCHAGPDDRRGRAYEIVRTLVPPERPIRRVLTEPMGGVLAGNWRRAYRPGVEQIAADCRQGLDVAFVTEGDPTLFSTAGYVWQLLAELYPEIPIEVVPGVSSVTAAAARVRWQLAQRHESLALLPAGYYCEALEDVLDRFDTVALVKVPRALPQLVEALQARPGHEAVYVENLGTAEEWLTHDLAAAAQRQCYFSLVLVRRARQRERDTTTVPGKLWVLGLGPGEMRQLTGQALAVLRAADVVLGYEGYVQLLQPLSLRADFRSWPIGAEVERATEALQRAAAGQRVVLVSSGDAGVYGMASLVLETAAVHPEVEVEVVPGVTAALAAAARLGAPLGHDFACISLSDLLTPWEVIERRLHGAAQADFVLALYNSVSQRRTWQLPRTREILLHYRGPQTPVGLVDKAYRTGERVWQATLGELSPEGVGMETLVVVGSSQTRVIHGRLVTPRGYGAR